MHMQKTTSVRNLFLILVLGAFTISSCGVSSNKKQKSSVTGWSYDDKNMGNFHVTKVKYPKAGPGLVFIQGGSFVKIGRAHV